MSEVKISKEEYKRLLDSYSKLSCLESGGVDNWDGYDDSMSEYLREKEVEDEFSDAWENAMAELSNCIEEPAGRGCGYGIMDDGRHMDNAIKYIKSFINNFYTLKTGE